MRIIHIVTGLSTGGAEILLQQQLLHPASVEHSSKVISLTNVGEIGEGLIKNNIPVSALQFGRKDIFSVTKVIRLAQEIAAFQPDVIHTWMYHSNLIGGVVARVFSQVPIVWTIHQDISDVSWMRSGTWAIIRLGALLARIIPHRIVAVAHKSVGSHVKIGYPPEKFTVIHNGTETNYFVPDGVAREDVRRELGLDGTARLIGYFARYHPMKDHRTFIKAAGIVHQQSHGVHFVLCGTGIEESNLELSSQIKEEGLEGGVHLLGLREDIPRLLASLDLYSISSLSEGFPLAVGEAMSSGVPCVVTDVGDVPVLVGDTGIIVPPRDPEALAGAWNYLLKKPLPELAEISTKTRQRIVDNFSLEEMVARYNKLYQEVVEGVAP